MDWNRGLRIAMRRTRMITPGRMGAPEAALLLWVLGASAALATTEEQIHRSFAVQPGGTLVVEVDFGSITVSTNATSEVVVDVWRKVKWRKKADEEAFLKDSAVQFAQEGTTVTVRSHRENRSNWSSFWGGASTMDARYTITVPAQFNGQLKTGGGGITVVDLAGEVKAHTGGGGLSLARVFGPLAGDTGGGDIRAKDCEGAIKLNTGGGGVHVSGGSGSLDLRTGGGSVSARKFDGPARLDTGGGDVVVELVTGEVSGSSGGGSVRAVLLSEVAGDVKLSTGGGGIIVSIPTTAAFNLDAKTDGGHVSTELPVTVVGKMEEGRLEGTVKGGGKAVVLRSGGGNIHLRRL
jgi:DUF4097 and DUF4098 domain-containing protein YvlB